MGAITTTAPDVSSAIQVRTFVMYVSSECEGFNDGRGGVQYATSDLV